MAQSYAIGTVNEHMLIPMLTGSSDPTAIEMTFRGSDLALGYQKKWQSSLSGNGFTLDSAHVALNAGNGALGYCGARNKDKKMWFAYSRWNSPGDVLLTNPGDSKNAEYTPDSAYDSTCLAVQVSSANPRRIYFAIAFAKGDPDSNWEFGILFGNFANGSGTYTKVSSDIEKVERGSNFNI